MAKKVETKQEVIEREYTIPLRDKVRVVPRYKKVPKAVKTVKEFMVRHMKVRDRDLNKIKIDKYLNEMLWFRGIKKAPHKIKVRAVKEGDIVRVYAVELRPVIEFKKARLEKMEAKGKEAVEAQKAAQKSALEAQKEKLKAKKKVKTEKKDVKTEVKVEKEAEVKKKVVSKKK